MRTRSDLAGLVGALREHGMELALDLALQMSPDHPWLAEHPVVPAPARRDAEVRQDPPKRYQDIHNLDWETSDRKGSRALCGDVVLHVRCAGVTVFRVDNPHTKPVPFWSG